MWRIGLILLLAAGCAFDAAPTPGLPDGGTQQTSPDASADGGAPDTSPDAPIAAPSDAAPPDAAASDAAPPPDAAPPGETRFRYVTRSLSVGSTTGEANGHAFDLDGDLDLDNKLGVMITSAGAGELLDAELDESLRDGDVVLLHSLQAASLFSDPTVTWRTYRGTPTPDPDLESGGGEFSVAPDSRTDSRVDGDLAAGEVVAGPGFLAVELALAPDMSPIPVELVGARLAADVTSTGCEGRLGGGIPATHLDEVLVPAIAAALDASIAADDGCRDDFDDCDGGSRLLLSLFDDDGDRVITVNEVRSSFIIQTLLLPDVDLLDEEGRLGADGVPESISFAVGFACTRAVFDEPGVELGLRNRARGLP